MCSSTRGPAIAPSLVTWPMMNRAVPLLLRVARELRGAFAQLRDRPGRRLQRFRPQRLDRIHHRDLRPLRFQGCDDALELDFRDEVDRPRIQREAPRPQRDLFRRLLARDIEGLARPSHGRKYLQQQRRLADARIAADQHHLARHQAAAQHAIELANAGRQALQFARFDLAERHGAGRRPGETLDRAALLGNGLRERAGGATGRTGAEPLQRRRAAVGADIGRLELFQILIFMEFLKETEKINSLSPALSATTRTAIRSSPCPPMPRLRRRKAPRPRASPAYRHRPREYR